MPHNTYSLVCSGPDGVRIDCSGRSKENLGLGTFDYLRLSADVDDTILMRNNNNTTCIAEVAYMPDIGLWSYFQLRKDKTEPNFITTVLGVCIELAEAISIEELEYKLLARNESENDFSYQLTNMKKKALDFQRQRTSKPIVTINNMNTK